MKINFKLKIRIIIINNNRTVVAWKSELFSLFEARNSEMFQNYSTSELHLNLAIKIQICFDSKIWLRWNFSMWNESSKDSTAKLSSLSSSQKPKRVVSFNVWQNMCFSFFDYRFRCCGTLYNIGEEIMNDIFKIYTLIRFIEFKS